MGRIVAIGGGDLNSTEKINKYAISMAKGTNESAESANVLFLGTASMDAEGYIIRLSLTMGYLL